MSESEGRDGQVTSGDLIRKSLIGLIIGLLSLYLLLGFDIKAFGLPTKIGFFALLPSANRLRVVSIAASAFLTLMLIYVYSNIGDIQQDQARQLKGQKDLQGEVNELQKKQTDILDQQEAWMRAEHTPIISVESWSVKNQQFTINISNFGNGVAKGMAVVLRIGPTEDAWPFEDDEIEFRGELREEHGVQVLKQSVDPVQFTGVPKSSAVFEEDKEHGLSEVLEKLDSGEMIYYRVLVEFEDLGDVASDDDVWVAEAKVPDADLTIQQLVENTVEEVSWFRSVEPKNLRDEPPELL